MRMDPPRGPDAATLLVRAIRGHAAEAGLAVAIRSIASRPWASATFVGMQHDVVIEASPGAVLATWIAALPDIEWSIRGHLIADVAVDAARASDDCVSVTLAILSIAED